jgi:succinyl-CoA synthetase beta subunit
VEDKSAVDPLEQAAKAKDLNYVKLDGEVGSSVMAPAWLCPHWT